MTPLPAKLPVRSMDSHKGTCGTVAIIGGNASAEAPMLGAPVLSTLAALRSGAGLAQLCMPEPLLPLALARCLPAIGVSLPMQDNTLDTQGCVQAFDRAMQSAQVAVIGPGWGSDAVNENAREVLLLRALSQDCVPLIVDADGLNLLCTLHDPLPDTRAPLVLTPHVGEFRRLAEVFKISADPILDGPDAAGQLSRLVGCVVVLKSAKTVVSDGMQSWTCKSGHPCLSTGGTGDVLAGTIAGLVAQHVRLESLTGSPLSLFEAACLGVEMHARAAQLWAIKHNASTGLLADELTDYLPRAAESLR